MHAAIIAAVSAAIGAAVATAVILTVPANAPASAKQDLMAASGIRIIEAGRDAQGCDGGEELLGAYCVSSPPNSVSASTVAFRKNAQGAMTLSCFTGGIRCGSSV